MPLPLLKLNFEIEKKLIPYLSAGVICTKFIWRSMPLTKSGASVAIFASQTEI